MGAEDSGQQVSFPTDRGSLFEVVSFPTDRGLLFEVVGQQTSKQSESQTKFKSRQQLVTTKSSTKCALVPALNRYLLPHDLTPFQLKYSK